MKSKSSNHRSENTYKFQTFQERLSNVNVDVARKVQRISSTPEAADTFFKEALDKWAELNCTQHFVSFRRGVPSQIHSLAQLVHHQNEIVDLLQTHLQVQGSLALQPLLNLVVQLGRDLQSDFYPYFEPFLHTIVKLLNSHHHDVEILEAAFTCLAYLFKFLWRLMIKDIENVYKLFAPLLSTSCRSYINNFAAESFAFLIRKVKDHGELFQLMFSSLEENPKQATGVGRLLYESVRGVQKQTNSAAEKIIQAAIGCLSNDNLPQEYVHESLITLWNALAEYLAPEYTSVIWSILINELDWVYELWKKARGKNRSHVQQQLECLLQLVHIWVEYKSGVLILCEDELSKALAAMLEGPVIPEEGGSLLLQVTTDFLTADKCTLAPHHRSKLVQEIFAASYEQSAIQDAARRLFDLPLFEKDVLGCLLQYCSTCVETSQSKNLPGCLHMITDLLLHKSPPPATAEDLEAFSVYPLQFPKFKKRKKEESLVDVILQLLDKSCSNLPLTELHAAQLCACVLCLPHLRGNYDLQSVKSLKALHSKLAEFLETTPEDDENDRDLLLGLWSECIVSLSVLTSDDLAENAFYESVAEVFRKNSSSIAALRALSVYCAQLKKHTKSSQHLSPGNFNKLSPMLEDLLSSKSSRARHLTLEVCTQFELPMVTVSDEMPDFQQIGVFKICLAAESVAADVHSYREKLLHLRKLDYDLVRHHLYEPPTKYNKVALKYLIGCLYINLTLLWEPVMALIKSHAVGMEREEFWEVWTPHLEKSAAASVSALLNPEKPLEDASDEENDVAEVYRNYQMHHIRGPDDRPDDPNFRYLLWKAMHSFPEVCEPKSEIVTPLFFNFLDQEYFRQDLLAAPTQDLRLNKQTAVILDEEELEEQNNEQMDESMSEKKDEIISEQIDEWKPLKKRRKGIKRAPNKTLEVHLTLFSKFNKPKDLHGEQRLNKLYHELLIHRSPAVQKVAFECIMTYKHKYLTHYKDNFFNLLDDRSFKNEIVLFSLDPETSIIEDSHRKKLLPVLMRILYGKMLTKTGKDTSGRQNVQVRRNIVMRFLGGCKKDELSIFLNLVFEPLQHLVTDNLLTKVKEVMSDVDLGCIIPVRKQLSMLNTVNIVFQKLSHVLDSYLPTLFHIIVILLAQCAAILQRREEVHPRCINGLKSLRQNAMQRLIQFFKRFDGYAFKREDTDAVFFAAVWPQLEKLPYEGVYNTAGPLTLFGTFARNNRYLPLLGKHHPDRPELTPLPFIFQLLHAKNVHLNVRTMIMEMIERLLGVKEEDDEVKMETDEELPPIQVGESVLSSDKDTEIPLGIRLLLNHVPTVLAYLRKTVEGLRKQGIKVKKFPAKEFDILARLSQYVNDTVQSSELVSLLLPFLLPKVNRSPPIELSITHAIRNLLEKADTTSQFIRPISKLFSTLSIRATRSSLCECVKVITKKYPEYEKFSDVLTKLNAWNEKKLDDEPDYMARFDGFDAAKEILASATEPPVDLMLMLLHNCCHFIKKLNDMALRDSATMCIKNILTYIAGIEDSPGPELVKLIVIDNLVPQIKAGITLESEIVRHEFINLLREIVVVFPHHPMFIDLHCLVNKRNADVDFFQNITHIQMHRRLRAMTRLKNQLKETPLTKNSITQFILPMVTIFLKNPAYATLQEITIEVVGVICRQLPWSLYYKLLKHHLNSLGRTDTKEQKQTVRTVVAILDSFHFDLSNSAEMVVLAPLTVTDEVENKEKSEANAEEEKETKTEEETETKEDKNEDDEEEEEEDKEETEQEGMDVDGETLPTKTSEPEEKPNKKVRRQLTKSSVGVATRIHQLIVHKLIPQLHRILTCKVAGDDAHKLSHTGKYVADEEVLRVPVALAMIKLMKILPHKTLDHNLPGVLLKICNFLRSRSQDVRETSRKTLVKIMCNLGARYFSYVLKELRSSLRRGYQLHVLCFTVHSLLNALSSSLKSGDLATSIGSLIEICNEELFGEVAEEKEVEGIRGKLKEAKSTKSYDIYKIISRFVTKETLPNLVLPLKEVLDTTHSHKTTRKVSEVLRGMTIGLIENKALELSALLTFTFGLTTEVLPILKKDKNSEQEKPVDPRLPPPSTYLLKETPKRGGKKAKTHTKTNLYLLVDFGLQLMNLLMKRDFIKGDNIEHLQLIDPFVRPIADCLQSKHAKVTSTALRCCLWILRFPLPSLKTNIKSITNSLFVLLNNYASPGAANEGTDNFELIVTCFKAVTVLVRDVQYHLIDSKQLQVLLGYAEQDIHDYTRQATAFTLLKAILSRKLIVPEMHDVMKKVEQLSITADSDHVRRQAREVALKFVMDYPLGMKLRQHVEFYVKQLDYDQETGRVSTLEMLASMFNAFPQKILVLYDGFFFIPLASRLINEESTTCKKLAAAAIKSLLAKLENEQKDKLVNVVVQWFQGASANLHKVAALSCGLMVEVESASFSRHLDTLMPIIEHHINSDKYAEDVLSKIEEKQKDQVLFSMLNLLLKIVRKCDILTSPKWTSQLADIFDHVQKHLNHPHMWVQLVAAQLFGLQFDAVDSSTLLTSTDGKQSQNLDHSYLATNTAFKIHSLCGRSYKQLSTPHINQELADQVVRNLVWLGKVLRHLPLEGIEIRTKYSQNGEVEEDQMDEKGHPAKSHTLSFLWLIKRLCREATFEMTNHPRNTIKRSSVYKWMAAVAMDMKADMLLPYLPVILPPLLRDSSEKSTTSDKDLRILCQEVLQLLKNVVGMEAFTKEYAASFKQLGDRREARKEQRAAEAVTNPEITARRKIKKNLKKVEAKKRKIDELRPVRKFKKKKLAS